MVERVGGDVGWAEHYFATVYTGGSDDNELWERVEQAEDLMKKEKWAVQVFSCAAAPLETTRFVASDCRLHLSRDRLHRQRRTLARPGLQRVCPHAGPRRRYNSANDREKGLFDYGESRRWFLLGDVGMAALVVAFAATVVMHAICG
jgi:hypothetical protein